MFSWIYYPDEAFLEFNFIQSWICENDVIISPEPRAILCQVILKSQTVVAESWEFSVSDEFREKCLDAD